ncbi:hypothetical protein HanOQP8_Chr09g0307401 [Helianthus annuus]|nr:hypothetical protein HanIR_Chr09g0394631 [Helianthus annuus]KAJ0705894.1 hypothetical protein HanLR1_Chr09g0300631 [Helianthus annuus]KAJ0710024.1 hypothetical protein HanOQP8_Chr09g0307401 [Helianthus annuus]KAJ0891376.1 hypothetical protein HanPSC8_Chr09g0352981 [Helianthus annuus]
MEKVNFPDVTMNTNRQKVNPKVNKNTTADCNGSFGYFGPKPQVNVPATVEDMGVKEFSPLNGSGVFNLSSDQGSNSFGCSADFGWDHYATTPEITSFSPRVMMAASWLT